MGRHSYRDDGQRSQRDRPEGGDKPERRNTSARKASLLRADTGQAQAQGADRLSCSQASTSWQSAAAAERAGNAALPAPAMRPAAAGKYLAVGSAQLASQDRQVQQVFAANAHLGTAEACQVPDGATLMLDVLESQGGGVLEHNDLDASFLGAAGGSWRDRMRKKAAPT
jgi:hypothetical protein